MLDWQFKIPMRVFLECDDVWMIHANFLTIINIINTLLQNIKYNIVLKKRTNEYNTIETVS